MYLAFNNLQRLICHKTKQTKPRILPSCKCVSTTIWMLKYMKKKLVGNYTRIVYAVLDKSWKQHPTKQQLYDHLPPIPQIIQVR